MYKAQFIIIFLIVNLISYSQSNVELSDTIKLNIDTNYVISYSDQLTLKLYTINKTNKITLFDPLLHSDIQYKPNEKVNLGFGMNYKWIGFGMAFNLGGSANNDDDKYGKTKQFDIQINAYSRKFTFDAYYQHYRGYYLLDPQKYNTIWTDSLPFPQRPDMGAVNLGFSGMFTNNFKKYSYRSSFIFNERQRKSAGSFLIGGNFSLLAIAGDSSLIPVEVKDSIIQKNNIWGAVAFNIGPAIGYTHTFIIKQYYFITMSLIAGISGQSINIYTEDPAFNSSKSTLSGRSQTRFAIGVNKTKWFLGLSAINDNYSLNNQSDKKDISKLNYEFGNLRFFYGRRFEVKKNQEIPN